MSMHIQMDTFTVSLLICLVLLYVCFCCVLPEISCAPGWLQTHTLTKVNLNSSFSCLQHLSARTRYMQDCVWHYLLNLKAPHYALSNI